MQTLQCIAPVFTFRYNVLISLFLRDNSSLRSKVYKLFLSSARHTQQKNLRTGIMWHLVHISRISIKKWAIPSAKCVLFPKICMYNLVLLSVKRWQMNYGCPAAVLLWCEGSVQSSRSFLWNCQSSTVHILHFFSSEGFGQVYWKEKLGLSSIHTKVVVER